MATLLVCILYLATPIPGTPLICNTTICNITCDVFRQCYNTTINASMSSHLNLYCTAEESCSFIKIIQGPSTEANIHCTALKSCKNATFNNNNTHQNVNIICDAPTDYRPCQEAILYASNTVNINVSCSYQYACGSMDFHIENADNATFFFNGWRSGANNNIYGNNMKNTLYILCKESMACDSINIYANSIFNNELGLDLNCIDDNSCPNAQIYCKSNLYTMLTYSDTNLHALECGIINNDCCPDIANKCDADTDCVVNCKGTQCQGKYIDGSLAKSLTVNCMGTSESCLKAKIQCPNGNNAMCNINCLINYGCAYMLIDAEYTNVLTLNCSESTSCRKLELIKGPMNEVNIECLNWHACASTKFNVQNTNVVNVNCNKSSYACYLSTINADNASIVNLNCMSANTCEETKLFVNYSDNATVNCNDTQSCTQIQIYADMAQRLDLKCNGVRSCDSGRIYCPYSNSDSCNIECLGIGSCVNTIIRVNDDYKHGYLHLKCVRNLIKLYSNSCDDIKFECIPSNYNTEIKSESYDLSLWECKNTDFDSCCPYFAGQYIICSTDICEINCSMSQSMLCKSATINGTYVDSLKVFCNDENDCINTKIHCPRNGNCQIYCFTDQACANMQIFAYKTKDISLSCVGNCNHITISADHVHKLYFHCLESNCNNIIINVYDVMEMEMLCHTTDTYDYLGCNEMHIYAENISVFEMSCREFNACYDNYLWLYNSKSIQITSTGNYSYNSNNLLINNSDSLIINCASNANNVACINSFYEFPKLSSNVNFNCYGTGCKNVGIISTESSINDINLLVNGCGECNNIGNCIEEMKILCNNNQTTEYFHGNYCDIAPTEIDCGCTEMLNYGTIFVNDPTDENCYDIKANITTTTGTKQPVFSTTIKLFYPTESPQSKQDDPFVPLSKLFIIIVIVCLTVTIAIIIGVICNICLLKRRKPEHSTHQHAQYNNVNKDSIEIDTHSNGSQFMGVGNEENNEQKLESVELESKVKINQQQKSAEVQLDSIGSNESMYDNPNNEQKTDTTINVDDKTYLKAEAIELDRMESNESMYDNPAAGQITETTTVDTNYLKAEVIQLDRIGSNESMYDNVDNEQITETTATFHGKTKESHSHELIRNWLYKQVGLAQYYMDFIITGYDSMEMIKSITTEQELINIDITNENHRNKILTEINKLKNDIQWKTDKRVVDTSNKIAERGKKYVIQWDTKDLIDWILGLQNGRYHKFKEHLILGFHDEEVNGTNIKAVNEQDLRHYGVNSLSDRKDLMKHIHNLVNSQFYEPQLEGQINDV